MSRTVALTGVTAGVVLLCQFGLSRPLDAQNLPADSASGSPALQEVVVTARKRTENVQTVPVSITAFSSYELQEQSVRTLTDVQGQVPGLYLQEATDDPQSLTFTMRGRKQSDVTLAVDPAVGLYIDGFDIPRTLGMAGSLVDIDRIEVLRGPQGTLYGRNTTGGAISVYTNDPTSQLGGTLDLTGGSFGTVNAVGIVNLPLADDLAARFVVQRGTSDGYGSNQIGRPLGSEDSQYYRAKLRWRPRDNVDALLSAHYESNHSGGSIVKLIGLTPAGNGSPEGGATAFEVAAETGLTIPQSVAYLESVLARSNSDYYDNEGTSFTFSNIKRWDGGLSVTVKLPRELELRWLSSVQGLQREEFFGSPIPATILSGAFHTEDRYFSQEVQLLGANAPFNWVAGAYGGYESGQDNVGVTIIPALAPGVAVNDAAIRNTNAALFAQTTWELVPRWHLTAGARYSADSRRADVMALAAGTCVVPAPGVESTLLGAAQCPRRFESSYRRPTWLASIDREVGAATLLYVKAAEGYRSGGVNEGGAVEAETFAAFPAERNIEYELGVKSEFLDRRVRVNADVYRDNYSNLQVTTAFTAADGNFATAVTSAARATISGGEAESEIAITPNLTVRGTAAYTDAHYGHFVDLTGDRSGEPFEVPRWTWSLSGRQTRPTSFGDLALQVDYDWRGTTVLAGPAVYRSQATQRAFGLLNARASVHFDAANIDVAVFGKNITSAKYLVQVNSFDGNPGLGVNLGYPGEPATYGIEVVKKFGSGP